MIMRDVNFKIVIIYYIMKNFYMYIYIGIKNFRVQRRVIFNGNSSQKEGGLVIQNYVSLYEEFYLYDQDYWLNLCVDRVSISG